jgi:hypothetical protein
MGKNLPLNVQKSSSNSDILTEEDPLEESDLPDDSNIEESDLLQKSNPPKTKTASGKTKKQAMPLAFQRKPEDLSVSESSLSSIPPYEEAEEPSEEGNKSKTLISSNPLSRKSVESLFMGFLPVIDPESQEAIEAAKLESSESTKPKSSRVGRRNKTHNPSSKDPKLPAHDSVEGLDDKKPSLSEDSNDPKFQLDISELDPKESEELESGRGFFSDRISRKKKDDKAQTTKVKRKKQPKDEPTRKKSTGGLFTKSKGEEAEPKRKSATLGRSFFSTTDPGSTKDDVVDTEKKKFSLSNLSSVFDTTTGSPTSDTKRKSNRKPDKSPRIDDKVERPRQKTPEITPRTTEDKAPDRPQQKTPDRSPIIEEKSPDRPHQKPPARPSQRTPDRPQNKISKESLDSQTTQDPDSSKKT